MDSVQIDLRGRLVAQVFFSELEKIARAGIDPMDIVRQVGGFEAARHAAKPDLWNKLKPGTGSFTQALVDRAKLGLEGFKVRGKATGALDDYGQEAMGRVRGAQTLVEKQTALEDLAKLRQAEAARIPAKPDASPSFFQQASDATQSASPLNSRVKSIMFGTGLGAAGLVAGQHYLNRQAEPQY